MKEISLEKNKAFLNKESFAIETVTSAISLAKEAKRNGYYINFHCILTQEKEVNIARVQNRVKLGGHDVPEELIKSRYNRFMNGLPEVIKIADNVKIYDNSSESPILIAEKAMGNELKIYPQI